MTRTEMEQGKPRTTAKGVMLNSMSNFMAVFINMAVGFVLLPFMVSQLGKSTYGVWELIGGLFGFSLLVQLGINSAVNYFIPQLLVDRDYDGINRVINTGLVFYLIGGGLIAVATVVFIIFLPDWFNVPKEHILDGRILAALVGGYFTLAFPLTLFEGVMSGLQCYVPMSLVRIAMHLTRAGLIVTLLLLGCGLVSVGIAHAGTRLAASVAMPILAKRRLPQIRLSPGIASMATFRMMVEYSVNTLIWAMGTVMNARAAFVVIGVLLTTTDATYFSAPIMIVTGVSSIAKSLSAASKPAASSLMAEGRMEAVRQLSLRGNRYVTMILWPGVVLVCAFSKPFLVAWMDPGFTYVSGILIMLTVVLFIELGQQVSANVLIGLGKHRPFAWSTLLAAVGCVIAEVVFVKYGGMGLWGIALGMALSMAAIGVIFVPLYTRHVLGISLWEHFASSFGRTIVVSHAIFGGCGGGAILLYTADIAVACAGVRPLLPGGGRLLLALGPERIGERVSHPDRTAQSGAGAIGGGQRVIVTGASFLAFQVMV